MRGIVAMGVVAVLAAPVGAQPTTPQDIETTQRDLIEALPDIFRVMRLQRCAQTDPDIATRLAPLLAIHRTALRRLGAPNDTALGGTMGALLATQEAIRQWDRVDHAGMCAQARDDLSRLRLSR